jgi:mannose-6-phosphate isomerase-like protein (cupin superfamily)
MDMLFGFGYYEGTAREKQCIFEGQQGGGFMYRGKPRKLEDVAKMTRSDALPVLEGGEFVKIFFHTERLLCALSTMLPGQVGEYDDGHRDAEEVCFCIAGNIVVHLPGKDKYVELQEDDAVIIPEGEPHQITNVGAGTAKMIFFAAPHIGR